MRGVALNYVRVKGYWKKTHRFKTLCAYPPSLTRSELTSELAKWIVSDYIYLWSDSSAVNASNSDGISLVFLSSTVVSSLGWHIDII